jgi:hypothetical protein
MSAASEKEPPLRPNDEELLKVALRNLKERGYIEFDGEFGNEIATFIPFVAWLKQEGLLDGRRVVTFKGMRPYYFFLSDDEFETKADRRQYRIWDRRKWPSNISYLATKQRWHVVSDYRSYYRDRGRTFAKPVLFIQNKFTVEWGMGPINYLPLKALKALFGLSVDRFHVVYSRPRENIIGAGYTPDINNVHCEYPDIALAREYENVEILEETTLREGSDYNATKLEIAAKAHVFVASQGGGAHVLACFGNSLLLVLHREGAEYPDAYASGPYKYLSDPPPLLIVARDNEQLLKGTKIVGATTVENGKPVVADRELPLIDELRL